MSIPIIYRGHQDLVKYLVVLEADISKEAIHLVI